MAATEIHVEPCGDDRAHVTAGDVEVVAERATAGRENATFYAKNLSVARVETAERPAPVPNMVRRAIEYGETATWSADEPGVSR